MAGEERTVDSQERGHPARPRSLRDHETRAGETPALPAGRLLAERHLVKRLPVLTYHSLDDSGSPISVAPELFRRQMASLSTQGWRTLGLDDLLAGHRGGGWPARTFALTFDDGFESLAEHGVPVLDAYRFSATVFVVAGWAGRTNDWPSQVSWAPRYPLLDWGCLGTLAQAGVEIGAHSVSHPHLSEFSRKGAEREVLESKSIIEDRIGRPVTAFAYPYGESSPDVRETVASHFRAGFGTRLGFVTPGNSVCALDRIDAYYLRSSWFFRAIDAQWFRAYLGVRRGLRALRHAEGRHS